MEFQKLVIGCAGYVSLFLGRCVASVSAIQTAGGVYVSLFSRNLKTFRLSAFFIWGVMLWLSSVSAQALPPTVTVANELFNGQNTESSISGISVQDANTAIVNDEQKHITSLELSVTKGLLTVSYRHLRAHET